MRNATKEAFRVTVPVVSATAADAVFAAWAEEFDVWAGYYWSPRCDRRHRAAMRFCQPTTPCTSYIYIAVAPTGPVKVGLSESPIKRAGSLRNYEAVVAIAAQTRKSERALHEQLRDFQVNGGRDWDGHLGVKYEWFERNSPVLSLAYRLANAAEPQIEEWFERRLRGVA